jgi:hypothetical protein
MVTSDLTACHILFLAHRRIGTRKRVEPRSSEQLQERARSTKGQGQFEERSFFVGSLPLANVDFECLGLRGLFDGPFENVDVDRRPKRRFSAQATDLLVG